MNAISRAFGPTRSGNARTVLAMLAMVTFAAVPAFSQDSTVLFEEAFDTGDAGARWELSGDWRIRTNSPCLPNELGYTSAPTALVFDYGSTCAYANNRFGYATLIEEIVLPITTPAVTLQWSDFVGAELGADFYFVEVSTDDGQTWPYTVLKDSADETFWDQESVDLSGFIGQTIRIRFGFQTDPSITALGWYIDDVQVLAAPLADGVSAVAIKAATVTEGNSGEVTMNFPVEIQPANAADITLEYTTVGGTALPGLDFLASSGPVTIPANTTSFEIPIQVRGDTFTEGTENFSVKISNPSANALITLNAGAGTILDDEQLTCLYEENFEAPVGSFQWTTGFPPGLPTEPAFLGLWHIQQASACLPSTLGYVSPSNALVFNDETLCTYDTAAGVSGYARMVSGRPIPGVEALTAQLSFKHYLEIAYNAIQPEVTTAYVEVNTQAGVGPWTILKEFKPTSPSDENYVIPWSEEVISLNSYIGQNVMVRFRFEQPDEINANTARGWYIDDFKICYGQRPAAVSKVTVQNKTETEGDSATKTLKFPVTITPANTSDITLSYQTVALATPNAATPEVDYVSRTGQKVIPAGTASTTLDVLILGDDQPGEGNEPFELHVTGVSPNVFLVNQVATGTIQDDDTPSTFTISVLGSTPASTEVTETDGTVTFEVLIDRPRSVPITVQYATLNGSALAGPGLDYVATEGSITFAPNTSTATFEVVIQDDIQFEDQDDIAPGNQPEEFLLKLTTDSPYADGGTPTAITLLDDEIAPPGGVSNLTIGDTVSAIEGSCPSVSSAEQCDTLLTATFAITLASPNAAEVSVGYSTVDGTAIAGEDYVASTGRVVFAPGDTLKTFTVPIWADRAQEVDETFQVVLSDPAGNVNVKSNTSTCTLRDDDFNGLTFGLNGDKVITRPLNDFASTPYQNSPVSGSPAQLTAAEFKGFEFGTLYGWDNNTLKVVSLVTNSLITKPTLGAAITGGEFLSGLAWDHTNGQAFAATTDGKIYEVDLLTATLTEMATAPGPLKLVSLSVHPTTGRMYAVAVSGAQAFLYKIIRGAWTFEQIGQLTDLVPGNAANDLLWDTDFDDATGDLYLNAYVAGDVWVTKRVDYATGETKSLIQNPPVSSLAIASPPTPSAVQWTSDMGYADTLPSGMDLEGGANLTGTDLGTVVRGIGDFNGDTFDDFAIAAPLAPVVSGGNTFTDAGKVFLLFGGPEGTTSLIAGFVNGQVTFENLIDGANGILIFGTANTQRLGLSVSGLGDVNGDKIADLILGYATADGADGAFLIYGQRLVNLVPSIPSSSIGVSWPGVKITGADPGDHAGASVSSAGDMNSDGMNEILIGAPAQGTGPGVGKGAAYVIFGSSAGIGSNGTLSLQALAAPRGLRINGIVAGDGFGTRVAGIGDVNGDGLSDFIATAPTAFAPVGEAYVIYGHVDYGVATTLNVIDLTRLVTPTPAQIFPGSPPNLSFTSTLPAKGSLATYIAPTLPQPGMPGALPGMRIAGQSGTFGADASGIGDFNGDGIDDFLISAPTYDGSAAPEAHWGQVYLFLGSEGNQPVVNVINVGGSVPGVLLTGIDDGDQAGSSLTGVGDINGDGLTDAVIGAKDGEPGGYDGEAYVLFGRSGINGTLSLRDLAGTAGYGAYLYNTGGAAGFNFGQGTGAAGDFDDDGISDFVLGRDNGALVILGDTGSISGVYRNRMRSGTSNLGLPVGGPDLGDVVASKVGLLGEGSLSRPLSRVGIQFTGGGTGTQQGSPSTQTVTIFREASPDLAVGDGTAEDDARWIPGKVYWKVETDRVDFTQSKLEFFYRPEEVAGFDLQKVKMYYAKPDAAPNANTTWSLLPMQSDPDRGVLSVDRAHPAATAQSEFNGYYALVQADFLIDLGRVIPSVGVTNDNVYTDGPTVVPANLAYWHPASKRLYAVAPGPLTITWRNSIGEAVSVIDAINQWPSDDSRYQVYVSGSPGVDFSAASPLNLQFQQLMTTDATIIKSSQAALQPVDEVKSNRQFLAQLTPNANPADLNGVNDVSLTGRALVMLSDNVNPQQGDLFFQFIKMVKWNNPQYTAPLANFTIGNYVGAATDPVYALRHDELTGSPFLFSNDVPYAPKSTRYNGYYDRGTRSGSIVFVNTTTVDKRPILIFYQQGAKLVEGRTGAFVRDALTNQNIPTFAWPHFSKQYNPVWPTANATNTIVIARQNGSQEIDPAVYGSEIDLYYQNTAGQPGFNPNEEHALIRPYGTGEAVFALRNDLNSTDTSQPWVLMTYKDPNDLLPDGTPRAKMRPFFVVDVQGVYQFQNWAGITGLLDPYEGEAGNLLLAPYPLSLLRPSPENTVIGNTAWQDRNKSIWAIAAGNIQLRFFYPVLDGFYFPQAYKNKYPTRDFTSTATDVPFLDGGPGVPSTDPRLVQYTTVWPVDAPVMNIGEILLEARNGLPQINGQCSVDVVYQESGTSNPSVKLIDPVQARSVALAAVPLDVETALSGSDLTFPGLPPALSFKISYNQTARQLTCKGRVIDPVLGFDYVLLNVLTADEVSAMKDLSSDAAWDAACDALGAASANVIIINNSITDQFDVLGLSTGNSQGTGYVTLAMQNALTCSPLPVSIEIIKVQADINPGSVAVVNPACVFEERLTLLHTNDFAGNPDNFTFEWKTRPDENGTIPPRPNPGSPTDPWEDPILGLNNPSSGVGLNEITIEGPGLLTLTDNWFSVRYKHKNDAVPYGNRWSEWTSPQLAPGWIKRVVGQINPFTQRAGGGGIEGAEASFATFSSDAPNVIGNMLSLAGPRYTGSIPLNCENLDAFGLLPIYGTVLDRGATLSIDALSPIDNPNVNNALLLAASRISDLYNLLGNEAYADAADPTIAFGTDDGEYGAEATSIHAFMNQTANLLEEELSLLRGRDETYGPGVQLDPLYNRLIWNFTTDFTGGEVAYALNYNLADSVVGGDGVISELDAKSAFPQGHGDAWGHYLTSMTTYYKLLRHPYFSWVNRSEAVLVGGQPVTVDFIDERKFARSAAAKARAGAEIVNLTYRQGYVEDPDSQWQALTDSNVDRAWGFSEWSTRAGQGTYIDWVVGNAILPAVDPDPADTGLTKIDRTTVYELHELAPAYTQIQTQSDGADQGLNPLGLGTNVIPFDINPADIDDGLTHFEQIYARAVTAMDNAVTAFDRANNSTQLLRRQADSQLDFERTVQDSELDFNARLVELFGQPYADDIGPGGSYPAGYTGPDIFHYMYMEESAIYRDNQVRDVYFAPTPQPNNQNNVPSNAESLLAKFAASTGQRIIGSGGLTVEANVRNFGAINSTNFDGTATDPLQDQTNVVKFNLALDSTGRLGLRKPAAWTGQRGSTGEIQLAHSEMVQALGGLLSALKEYQNYLDDIDVDIQVLEEKFRVNAAKFALLEARYDRKLIFGNVLFALRTTQIALRTAATLTEKISAAVSESVPTVTGIIIGFSNGIIIDGLAPVRGTIETVGAGVAVGLNVAADLIEIANLRLELEEDLADDRLTIDTTALELNFDGYESVKAFEKTLGGELPLRFAVYNQYEALNQAIANYGKVVADAERTLNRLDIFRKRTAADQQAKRYKDMAFRIFRNEQLQKYRAQFDLAARYTYLAAKAYDYETTMLSTDARAGQKFLTDIVRARSLGTLLDGEPQPGQGLANALAIMSRNFDVLSGQLGFNNPQVETNRFSLRYELFRQLVGPAGDGAWANILNQDYASDGVGRVDNLWDVPEFAQYCVPPADFGDVEPGIIIPFSTTIKEGKNFFGEDAGGFDNSYDSTQFATKIRSVGIWFTNYDFFNLSNTPRVYLVPVGMDVLRSPTGFRGTQRQFKVLDQILPVPYPIGDADLDDPSWIPSVDGLDGTMAAMRRFGRLRAYHDSGEFDAGEVNRDSRLIGRSVWNTKWMLIIPGSTLSSEAEEGIETFINGREVSEGLRDGNGVKDIKIFFETYAYPRVKSGGLDKAAEDTAAQTIVIDTAKTDAGN